ncbi:hypothetical protein [Pseudovibrio sp. Tun.PSC04-5.I4]|uniref:hypothetical protein n=1 Tax=Pseudovibrio sp. Tun.PSC04-5.I4 TaxID=1798213 RepID=UPI001179A331|nr:hypothetical protein [Pseudovibrio sp. Tun.PSC04-5.I4]
MSATGALRLGCFPVITPDAHAHWMFAGSSPCPAITALNDAVRNQHRWSHTIAVKLLHIVGQRTPCLRQVKLINTDG